jgi:hypothetical protein
MKNAYLAGLAALLATPLAFAGDMPKGQFGGHVTLSSAEVEDTPGGFADFDDDGTGFGIKGWGMVNENVFLHGEYQTVTTDDFDIDIDQIRLGGGYASGNWIFKGEYIDTGSDLDQAGFGVHGGLHTGSGNVGFFGTVGYLMLDDVDGLELDVGGSFGINRDWSIVADYRIFMGSLDPDGDLTLGDLRIGAAYNFH